MLGVLHVMKNGIGEYHEPSLRVLYFKTASLALAASNTNPKTIMCFSQATYHSSSGYPEPHSTHLKPYLSQHS